LLLQVAQDTTTHTGTDGGCRGSARRVAHSRGWPAVPGPDLRREVTPRWCQRVTGTSRALPQSPDPVRLKQGIACQAGGRHGPGQAGPAICTESLTPGARVAVACHVPIRATRAPSMPGSRTRSGRVGSSWTPRRRPTAPTPASAHPASARTPSSRAGESSARSAAARPPSASSPRRSTPFNCKRRPDL